MKTITIRHENDRGTIPRYHTAKGGKKYACYWIVEIGKEPMNPSKIRADVPRGEAPSFWTTKKNAEDILVAFGESLGITDTTDAKQWKAKGYKVVIRIPAIGTFNNWPE